MTKLYLSPLVDVIAKNNKIYLCDDDIFGMHYEKDLYRIIKKLQKGCEEKDIYDSIGYERGNSLIKSLKKLNYIKKNNNNFFKGTTVEKQIEYLYSLSDDGNRAQEILKDKTICIIGVGGIGSVAIQHLVAAGVEKYVLIDRDTVNTDNFNRQLIFKIRQLNKYKVYAASEYIKEIEPRAKVKCINKYIEKEEDLNILDSINIDFVICGADMPYNKIQKYVSNYCGKRNIPSIYAQVGINFGNWGPIIDPLKDKTYKDYMNKIEKEMNEDELIVYKHKRKPLSASFGVTNTIVGTFMTFEVIKYFCSVKKRTGRVFAIDFNNNIISEENINNEE